MGRLGVTEILVILAIVLLLLVVKKSRINERFRKRNQRIQNAAKDGQPADKRRKKQNKRAFHNLKSLLFKKYHRQLNSFSILIYSVTFTVTCWCNFTTSLTSLTNPALS
jgi:sec-independent protein translocase protein TatA